MPFRTPIMEQEFADLIQSFLEDSTEHLDKVEDVLLALDPEQNSGGALQQLEEIKRPLHTLKGNAGMLGFLNLSKTVHLVEDLLKGCLSSKQVSPEQVDIFFGAVVQLKTALRDIAVNGEEPENLAEDMESFLKAADKAEPGSGAVARVAADEGAQTRDVGGVTAITTEVIRVRSERIDNLLQEIGDLSIFLNSLTHWYADVAPELGREARFSGQANLDRVRAAFLRAQERAVELRMVPLDTLFKQIPRWTRDLSRELGKSVSAKVTGGELLLDKHIVERLQEPFIHLIRNSIDHGIESPEERKEWGKPDRGAIRIEAIPQAGALEIRVVDDGRGLDRDRLIEKAQERGIIGQDEVPAQWEELIFSQGLSTAASISQVSGRGVGMDIVKMVVQELDGNITVTSEPGLGTTFVITVPLTLAVTNILKIDVLNSGFGIPVRDIEETDLYEPRKRSRLSGREVYRLAEGQVVPMFDLRRLCDPGRQKWPVRHAGYLVRIRRGDRQAVLVADQLLGEENVVLKPLRDSLFDHEILRSASIEGDGSVIFVLDTSIVLREGMGAVA